MSSYIISRTSEETGKRRYMTVTVDAPTMDEALEMDAAIRMVDAGVAVGELIDLASGADEQE